MKFKVDENLPVEVVDLLPQVGYDAATVFDQNFVAEANQQVGPAITAGRHGRINRVGVEIGGNLFVYLT